ncbi:hypothetical protein ACFWW7_20725, partial [Streptomyces sp. NPDC059071]
MDYCHQCRRHLNGALACAGCGTPAEELRYFAPPTSFRPPAAAPAPAPAPEPTDTPSSAVPESGPDLGPEFSYELDPLEPPRPAEGRAAARRRAKGGGRSA